MDYNLVRVFLYEDLPIFGGDLVEVLTPFHISPLDEDTFVIEYEEHWVLPVVLHDSSGQFGQFRIYVDGSLMQVKSPRGYGAGVLESSRRGLRGQVKGFTAAARRRLLRFMATLRQDVKPVFVTLTYPLEYPSSFEVWKNDLDKFARRFRTKYSGGTFIWRLEPQKRGAPHYHLLVYGVIMDEDFVGWVHNAWYECVKSGDLKHLVYGVKAELLRSVRGVRSYVSKYIAKKQSLPSYVDEGLSADGGTVVDWSTVGRWWGVRYSDNLPKSECLGGAGLSWVESFRLLRAMRKYLRSKGVQVSGVLRSLTMFIEFPKEWVRALDGITRFTDVGNGSFLDIGKAVQVT